jgi:predicted ABC-type ATPase
MAGPNGSGKTSITQQLLQHAWAETCLYINPDQIAQDDFGGWNSRDAFLKAASKAEHLRERCLAERQSLIFETVFSQGDKVEFLRKAQATGYFVRLFFVCTNSPEINTRRIARRVRFGGHDVPVEKIVSRFERSIRNCAEAVSFVDRAYCYDNSVENGDPLLLFRSENGKLKRIYSDPVNPWAQSILHALKDSDS